MKNIRIQRLHDTQHFSFTSPSNTQSSSNTRNVAGDIMGYSISAEGLEADVRRAWKFLKMGWETHHVACANPHSLVVANTDPEFRDALKHANILLPDGIGIVVAAKLLRQRIRERVAGTEFFLQFSKRAQRSGGIRYFFLGATEEVLEKIVVRLRKDFPKIEVCGTYSPPFKTSFTDQDSRKMLAAINQAKPDVLWVGMTAPKQEKWIEQHRAELDVALIGSIGAVFDFYSGIKKRAPKWICDIGLEWLPRLVREPARLWRRVFLSTPKFCLALLTYGLMSAGKKQKPILNDR